MAPRSGSGEGHGKVILLGEHAVVYGLPAIAAGISLGARATLTQSDEHSIRVAEFSGRSGDGSELVQAFEAACAALGAGPYDAQVEVSVPLGSGLGGSAAIGVAVVRGLLAAEGLVDRARERAGVTAWEAVFHGTPSGVDAAAASSSGCIWFTKAEGARALRVGRELELAICLAGPPASTKEMVENVRKLAERRPDLVGKTLGGIEALVKNGKLCIEAGDATSLGELMNLNQMLLAGLFLSTPDIERACAVARAAGALGAKLTGSGGGGAVIALAGSHESGQAVASALTADGFKTFTAQVASHLEVGE